MAAAAVRTNVFSRYHLRERRKVPLVSAEAKQQQSVGLDPVNPTPQSPSLSSWSPAQGSTQQPQGHPAVSWQKWSLIIGGLMLFVGNMVSSRALEWERNATFAQGLVLTLKDHTRKTSWTEEVLPYYSVKVGFTAGERAEDAPRIALKADVNKLMHSRIFDRLHMDGFATPMPVLYDSTDPMDCRLDDGVHYNAGKLLMFIGMWAVFAGGVAMVMSRLPAWEEQLRRSSASGHARGSVQQAVEQVPPALRQQEQLASTAGSSSNSP